MAIYNLRVEPDRGRSAVYRYEYILRVNNFSWEKDKKYDDFLYAENINMPSFASNPKYFWECCELYERKNSNTFRTIDFSLPAELSEEENIELATSFAKNLFKDKFVYSLTIHSKPSSIENINNIHCHIMFSERELDGTNRPPELFFKRYNSKNPSLGGCKKDTTWTKYSVLYNIRETWEKIVNEKLEEYNFEKISSKSLFKQRLDSLCDENYLKAELLDRPPVHIDKKYLDYSPDTPEKEKATEFYNYAKKIKEIKEKEFKLKYENFEEENLKARDRFLKSMYGLEGKEYIPSDFDVNKYENFNFENIFIKSLENNILLERKENRLQQIMSMSNEDIKKRAIKILTRNEYFKNEDELKALNEIYDNLTDKETFEFSDRKKELENYFKNLSNNEYFNNKLQSMEKNIITKYELQKEKIFEDLKILRCNNFRDFYLENTPKNYERSKIFLKETKQYINELKFQKENIDLEVKEYKEKHLNKDFKLEFYKEFNPILAQKYLELETWKKELLDIKTDTLKKILEDKIKARELGFKSFDIEHKVKDKIEENLKEHRKKYKELRQIQDDIKGKLSCSFLMLKELKKIDEINLLDRKMKLLEEYNDKISSNSFEKLEYNTKLSLFKKEYEKFFKEPLDLPSFNIPKFHEYERKEYIENIKLNILTHQEKLKSLQKDLSKNLITEEKIKESILNKYTNGLYGKKKVMVNFYKENLTPENKFRMEEKLEIISNFEKEFKITEDMAFNEKLFLEEKNMDLMVKIREENNILRVNFKMLKDNGNHKIRKVKPIKNVKPLKHLRVVQSGRISIEEESKKRNQEYENYL